MLCGLYVVLILGLELTYTCICYSLFCFNLLFELSPLLLVFSMQKSNVLELSRIIKKAYWEGQLEEAEENAKQLGKMIKGG